MIENNHTLGFLIQSTIHFLLWSVLMHKCSMYFMDCHPKCYSITELLTLLSPHISLIRNQCKNCFILNDIVTASEIAYLIVNDKQKQSSLAVDLHVYSRNQQFRLFECVKHGQNNILVLSNDFPYRKQRNNDLVFILHASMITTANQQASSILHLENNLFSIRYKSNTPNTATQKRSLEALNQHMQFKSMRKNRVHALRSHIKNEYQSQPLQIDQKHVAFVQHLISKEPNHQGYIRSWTCGTCSQNIVFFNIGGDYRYCPKKGAHHLRNTVSIIIDTKRNLYSIRCKDPQCDNAVLFWNKID